MRRNWFSIGLVLVTVGWAQAATIEVKDLSQGIGAETLVNRLLGGGVTVFNVTYTGATNASGVFCNGLDAVDLDIGISLTSGSLGNVLPPNNSSGDGADNELGGDPDLDNLIPGYESFDAATLEFDFIPQGNSVQFNYVFASEEYNEFVNSPYNDVFGFFVNGVNYALIPGGATPVAINNVNNGEAGAGQMATGPCQNCEFYVDNAGTNGVRQTQMDGLTTVLTLTAPVLAGQTNHMKIAIADAGDHILDSAVFIEAGSFRSGASTTCVTRDARFWFTHAIATNDTCLTLAQALAIAINTGCNGFDMGYLELPVGYRNDDNVRDAIDATMEALGFYYRNANKTGELAGFQNLDNVSSKLCRERKRLSVEFLAATANNLLLLTDPTNCTQVVKGIAVPYPGDLLTQAREVLGGNDIDAVRSMTVLLSQFNSSGVTNPLPDFVVECNAQTKKDLRELSRDATTQASCPGLNDSCQAAEAIVFRNATNLFLSAKFKGKANMLKYTDTVPSPPCASGGREAIWVVTPTTGKAGRQFTVSTAGSNYDTILSIFKGDCINSNVNFIACNDDAIVVSSGGLPALIPTSRISFTTDGTNSFYIVGEGKNGTIGSLKLTVTSP